MNILEKINLIPSKIKDYILIGLIVSIVIIVIVMSINNYHEVRRQVNIEKTKNELVDTKARVEQDKKALQDNVKEHDSFVQITVEEIKNITKIKPKRIKYESIKVTDTTYAAMRNLLDTVQPNK
jgi:Tfp pilus assembly protein PilE